MQCRIPKLAWLALAGLLALCPDAVNAQGGQTTQVRHGDTLPTTCNPRNGDIFFLTSGTIGINYCITPNTWMPISGAGLTIPLTLIGPGSGNPFGAGPTIAQFGATDNNGTPLLVTNDLVPTAYISSFLQQVPGLGVRGYAPYFFDGINVTTLEMGYEAAPFPGNNMNITTTDPTAYVTVEGYVGLAPFTDNSTTLGFAARRWSSLNVAGAATFGSVITSTHTPTSSSDTCTTGQFAWDSSFLYQCVATNTWKRGAIGTW